VSLRSCVIGMLAISAWPGALQAGASAVIDYADLELAPLTAAYSASTHKIFGPIQVGARFGTLHWTLAEGERADLVFSLTIAELGGGFFFGGDGFGVAGYGGTAPGLGLWLGDGRAIQLQLSLGLGVGLLNATSDLASACAGDDGCHLGSAWVFMLSPSLRLHSHAAGKVSLGAGLRAQVPAWRAGGLDEYGAALTVFFEVGYSNWQKVMSPAEPAQAGAGPRGE